MPINSIWILLGAGLYGLIHSLLASMSVKAFIRRALGPLADRYYRLAFNIFGLLSLIPVLALVVLLPDKRVYSIPLPWSLPLLALQGLAVIGVLVGVLQTGVSSFLGFKQLFEPLAFESELVTGGVYRYVRHPLYSAGIVFLWASPLMTRNLFFLFLGLTGYFVIGALFEERKLLTEYGPAYARYRDQTPMFIPRLKGLKRR